MEKPRKGLGVLKGFRNSRLYGETSLTDRDISTHEGGVIPHTYVKSHSKHDVATALKAMEQRVNALLEDRYRLAQDLHDCILQSLYALGLTLELSRQPESSLPSTVQETYDQAVTQLNHLICDVRAMIESLEAGTIREFDFAAELSSLQATYEQGGRLTIRLDLDETALSNLTREEQREILNIVREALSNCARHADASRVVVAIRMRGSKIRVSIVDDGRGFALNGDCRRGYGLTNMEARARKLGGTFRVASTHGQGTTVTIDLSLSSVLTFA
ncbi:MAG: sensor histidine kinase [Nitrospira sp.]|nr:sensor histidine kinase [Nitrospira sp.]